MTNNVRGRTATIGQDACIEKQFDKKAQQRGKVTQYESSCAGYQT
jgi:hypothetical protein